MKKFKVIIFDADGMVIRAEMFSDIFSREYNIPLNEILAFFENEFKLCLIGKADVKKELKKYLKKWQLNKPVNEFLDEWFQFEDKVDTRLIKIIKKLQKSGIKCILGTNQEKYRTRYLLDKMAFGKVFDKIFSSADIGYRKPQQEFYQFIYDDLKKTLINLKKSEVLFCDDREKNVKAACDFGFEGWHYKIFKDFSDFLVELE